MIVFHLEPAQLLQLLASVVFPLLVGLITTRDTHPGRRAVLLAALSVVTALAAQLADALTHPGIPFDLFGALLGALASFLIAVGLHFGFWNPLGVAAAVQNIGSGPAGDALPAEQAPAATVAPETLTTAADAPAADPAAPRPPAAPVLIIPAPVPVAVPVIHDPAETFVDPSRPGQ
jgi:phosphotransferase system  glucose/maltose/N-acetylglucosamine-specific IIC component